MNIWLLRASEPIPTTAPNIRLMRMGMIAEELTKRGHHVIWFSNTFDHFQKKQLFEKDTILKIQENYSVYLLHALKYKKNISAQRILHHKIIASKFRKISRKLEKPDLIYVAHPTIEFSEEAVKYGKKYNVPTIVDIRDLWPDIFYHNLSPKLRLLATPYIKWMDYKTKNIMKNAFAINGVSEEMVNWGLKKGKREKKKYDRYFYIGYEKTKQDEEETIKESIIDKNKFNICFFATINNQFDYEKISILAKRLEEKDNNIMIHICGDGPQMSEFLKKLQEISNVKLWGWTEKDKLTTILKDSKLGLAPYKNTFDFQMGVSNKFAEYISYGLPIALMSDGYMKEILKENDCGITTGDMKKMCQEIIDLKSDEQKYQQMSQRALNLYQEKFEAHKIYEDLADYLEQIVQEKRRK